jgi:membrane protein DedA with SNARE-associated domain
MTTEYKTYTVSRVMSGYVWIALSVAFLVFAFGSLAFLTVGRMDLSAFGVIVVAILLLISEAYKKRKSKKGERS